MSVTVDTADAYFARDSHPRAMVWEGFTYEQKAGALVHARRILSRTLLRLPAETATVDGDAPREDLALYEQALFVLENSPYVATGAEPSPSFVSTEGSTGEARQRDPGQVSDEAQRWLRGGLRGVGAVQLCRG